MPAARMNTQRRQGFDREIALGREFIAAGDLERAFRHRARPRHRTDFRRRTCNGPFAHVHAGNPSQASCCRVGQAVRLVLGVIGSAIGVVPIGNTGGTDISMFKRLPIAPDLQTIIDGTSVAHDPRDAAPD